MYMSRIENFLLGKSFTCLGGNNNFLLVVYALEMYFRLIVDCFLFIKQYFIYNTYHTNSFIATYRFVCTEFMQCAGKMKQCIG
jgi:hypothetical protein